MQPEGTIFSLGATLQGLALTALLVQLYAHQAERIRRWNIEPLWARINQWSLVPGLIATGSSVALAWLPWNDYLVLHRNLALGIFIGGALCGFSTCLLSWRFGKIDQTIQVYLRWRILGSIVVLLALIGLLTLTVSVFGAADFDRETYLARTYNDALFCHSHYDQKLNVAAVCEWVLLGGLMAVIATVKGELGPIIPLDNDS
jgi:hypothetical protein